MESAWHAVWYRSIQWLCYDFVSEHKLSMSELNMLSWPLFYFPAYGSLCLPVPALMVLGPWFQ